MAVTKRRKIRKTKSSYSNKSIISHKRKGRITKAHKMKARKNRKHVKVRKNRKQKGGANTVDFRKEWEIFQKNKREGKGWKNWYRAFGIDIPK